MNIENQGWILPSDHLPKNHDRVLVTIRRPGKTSMVRSANYYEKHFSIDNGDYWKATDERLAAWMPLPKPYRKGSRHDS